MSQYIAVVISYDILEWRIRLTSTWFSMHAQISNVHHANNNSTTLYYPIQINTDPSILHRFKYK